MHQLVSLFFLSCGRELLRVTFVCGKFCGKYLTNFEYISGSEYYDYYGSNFYDDHESDLYDYLGSVYYNDGDLDAYGSAFDYLGSYDYDEDKTGLVFKGKFTYAISSSLFQYL